MRRKVEIVWLEDDLYNREHESRVIAVKEIVEEKGYYPEISQVSTLSEAKNILDTPSRRVDFFISDFNLGSNETGLDYLIDIRYKKMYKQFFILYSKNEYSKIKEDVIVKLNDNYINLFCNFTFISLGDSSPSIIREDFTNAVNISLSRWDELNAIRGLYMCEHAEIEYLLRKKYNCIDDPNQSYKDLFNKVKRQTSRTAYGKIHRDSFDQWEHLIDSRNLLAHVKECFNNEKGFYIESTTDENLIIYENGLDKERVKLKNLKDKIEFLIENPNRVYNQ